jgi:hypothetical protein
MAQAVSRWPLTAEARVLARVFPCGICGGQSGTGQVFSEYFGFPCKCHSTVAPYSSITAPWGVRLLWPSSTLSQPRSKVRGFTSDPAHWLETEKRERNNDKKHQSCSCVDLCARVTVCLFSEVFRYLPQSLRQVWGQCFNSVVFAVF